MANYTLDSLKAINGEYDRLYGVTQGDVDKVNETIAYIEKSRNEAIPQDCDMLQYTNETGRYFSSAHIEKNEGAQVYICESPSLPFVSVGKNGLLSSTSGGSWEYIPSNLKLIGEEDKAFRVWGHEGPIQNGALKFLATVNVWEYSKGKHTYTTRTHDKFTLSIKHDDERTGTDLYALTKGIDCLVVLHGKEEYDAWLKTFNGIQFDEGYGRKIVWSPKLLVTYVPLHEYIEAKGGVIDSELCNGVIQECKRFYEDNTIMTYMPYQQDKIELRDKKRFMNAY